MKGLGKVVGLLTIVIGLIAAAPAAAATPFTVGSGESPNLAVGEDGTLYITWDDGENTLTYCRVPPGATSCATTRQFANPATCCLRSAGLSQVLDRGSGAITILQGWGNFGGATNARTYAYNSSDGMNFSPAVHVGEYLPSNAVYAGANSALSAAESGEPRIVLQRLSLFGPLNSTRAALLPGAGNGSFDDPDVGLAPRPVVVYSGSGAAGTGVLYNRYNGPPGGESTTANWSGPTQLDAQGSAGARVGAGPNTTWVMYTKLNQNNAHVLRQWNGTSFGPATQIGDFNTNQYLDVAVSPNDRVYGVWNRLPGDLRWYGPGFINGGTAATGQAIYYPRLDANSRGLAVAVWQNDINRGQITVARLDLLPGTGGPASNQPGGGTVNPRPGPGPIVAGRTSSSKLPTLIEEVAVELSLTVPRDCVARGNRLRAKLTARQIRRLTRALRRKLKTRRLKRGGFKITRVDFKLDGRAAGTDRRRPFEVVLDTAGLAAGRHTVAATSQIKRTSVRRVRGKRRTVLGKRTYRRALSKGFSVCR